MKKFIEIVNVETNEVETKHDVTGKHENLIIKIKTGIEIGLDKTKYSIRIVESEN